jgi:hypothetical protein
LVKTKAKATKLWQETRDPVRKTAVKRVKKTIREMTPRKALEQKETKIENYEVTPQATWSIEKSLMTRNEPKAPTTIYGPPGLKYHLLEKASTIADSLKKSVLTP